MQMHDSDDPDRSNNAFEEFMERKERIEREILKTMECFNQAEHIEADPFFFTRLQARLTSEM